MHRIPRDQALDSTLALRREGYAFIGNRCARLGTDLFQTRLRLQRTLCMRGREAAMLFYDGHRFHRRGAAPNPFSQDPVRRGRGTGPGWGGHRRRKALFMSLMTPESVQAAAGLAVATGGAAVPRWEMAGQVVVLDAASEVLTRTACGWTGVPLGEAQAGSRSADLRSMVELAAAAGPGLWRARRARARSEAWARDLLRQARTGDLKVAAGAPLAVLAGHREDGRPLALEAAAVELINLLRPIVPQRSLVLCG